MSFLFPEAVDEEYDMSTGAEVLLIGGCAVVGMLLFAFLLLVTAVAPPIGGALFVGCAVLFVMLIATAAVLDPPEPEESE